MTIPKAISRIMELRRLLKAEEVSESNGAVALRDRQGEPKTELNHCLTCYWMWDNALIGERTPVPAGRCPYEHIHPELRELRILSRRHKRFLDKIDNAADRLLGRSPNQNERKDR